MQIGLKIDDSQLQMWGAMAQKKIAYGVVSALNSTAKRVQQAEFENVRNIFTVRRPGFFFGYGSQVGGAAARISPFASVGKGRPFAEVHTATMPGGGGDPRFLLPIFERGGPKPKNIGVETAIPWTGGAARPSFPSQVPREFTFRGMGLKAWRGGQKVTVKRRAKNKRGYRKAHVGIAGEFGRIRLNAAGLPTNVASDVSSALSGGNVQWKGRNRTYLIPHVGVFRRTGPKSTELVWLFHQTVKLDSRLHYVHVAQRTSDKWMREEMERELIKAMGHASRR